MSKQAASATELPAAFSAALADRYAVGAQLGRGGMATVYVAEDLRHHRRVALKVLDPDLGAMLGAERFLAEIQVTANLQHPNLLPLFDSGEAAGLLYYVMPLIEGATLRTRLDRERQLPVDEAVRIVREIAGALDYAHRHGVVHRDLKPENILLQDGLPLVADFGIALAVTRAGGERFTATGLSLGTPQYMSPEQAVADRTVDGRSDIYSLACVLYELLVGDPPFTGSTVQAVIAKVLAEPVTSVRTVRASVPAHVDATLARALSKLAADRYSTAREFADALASAPSPSHMHGPEVHRPHLARRSRGAVVLGVAMLLAAAGGWFALARMGEPAPVGRRIAVVPFKNETGDTLLNVFGRMIAHTLSQDLSRSDSVEVVPYDAVAAATTTTPSDGGVVDHVARATRASILVHGAIYVQGNSLRVQASVTDVRSGQELFTLDPAMAPQGEPNVALDELRDRLLAALQIDRGYWLMTRAPRLSAYRELEGAMTPFRRGDFPAARPFLYRALSLDSTLSAAYMTLATTYFNVALYDSSEAVVARWARLQDGFAPDERQRFEWQKAMLSGNLEQILTNSQRLAKRNPDAVGGFLTGLAANAVLRADLALASLQAIDSSGWARGQAVNFMVFSLAEAHHLKGRHADELDMLHRRRQEYPSEPQLRARDLRALAALGRRPEASALADTLLRGLSDSTSATITNLFNLAAMEFEAHGDSAAAAALAHQVAEWFANHPTRSPSVARRKQQGVAWLLTGMLDSAHRAFATLARDTSPRARASNFDVEAAGSLGVTLVRMGEHARARAVADSLGTLSRKWLFGSHTLWRAAILGELGERELAVDLLGQAHTQGYGKSNWHFANHLRVLRGFPSFEALIKPRD